MKPYSNTDKKILAIIGILSSQLALGCLIVGLEATHYDAEAFVIPSNYWICLASAQT